MHGPHSPGPRTNEGATPRQTGGAASGAATTAESPPPETEAYERFRHAGGDETVFVTMVASTDHGVDAGHSHATGSTSRAGVVSA